MKTRIFILFLILSAACVPAKSNTTEIQNTAIAAAWTEIALAQTALPTATLPPTFTPTATFIYPTPSPLPTEPVFPIITPDPIQVERWNEYEDALAKTFFSYIPPQEVVCEWIILGRADQEVYVYAYCAGTYSADPSQGSIPAVIHIGMDGSVQSAEIPGAGSAYGAGIRRMFPADVQEKIFSRSIYVQELWERMQDRLRWRRGHPEEPPLIVLNSLPTQPTQPVIPWITPDSIQMERWKEYQTVLAKDFLSYLPSEQVICEWELLGRTGNEVYVWAICAEARGVGSVEGLAVIYIDEAGSVYNAVTEGIGLPSRVQRMFPLDVQKRYFGGLIHFQELVDHLRWRQRHQEEPPLIVLSVTPSS